MPDEVLSPASSGAFAAPSADLTAVLTGPAIARLSGLGTIRAEGADATGFLQSQLTNDVTHLGNDAFQLNGYCTPKGRLLATFHQWRDGEAVMLQLPRELVAAVTKRLSMFVLRAKVRLADASDQWTTHALLGPQASEALRVAGMDAPAQTWASVENAGLRVSRLPAAPNVTERFLLTHAGSGLPAPLAALPVVSSDAWWWSEVAAGVPTVFLPTQEKFVPQMINFEVLGGVNFKKGCYPGQEIVARSQYLGKLRRRMQVAHARVEDPPAAGSDVFQSAQDQPVGTVVMAARAPGGGVDLLFEAPVDRIGTGTLHIGSAGGAELRILPLPYELFDPTA